MFSYLGFGVGTLGCYFAEGWYNTDFCVFVCFLGCWTFRMSFWFLEGLCRCSGCFGGLHVVV